MRRFASTRMPKHTKNSAWGGAIPATWGLEVERRRYRDAEGVEGEGESRSLAAS